MRAPRPAVVATTLGLLALAALIAAVACGGDDTDTPPSDAPAATTTIKPTPDAEIFPYFQELDAIFQRASDDSVTADAALGAALSAAQDVEATRVAYTAFLTATEGVFEAAIVAMNGIQVPPVAQAGHNEFVAAAESSKNLAAKLRADIAGVAAKAQLDVLLEDFGTASGPLLDEADAACTKLQGTAITHGIDVDLACNGG
jgi:hypothetical protein